MRTLQFVWAKPFVTTSKAPMYTPNSEAVSEQRENATLMKRAQKHESVKPVVALRSYGRPELILSQVLPQQDPKAVHMFALDVYSAHCLFLGPAQIQPQ